MLFEVAVSAALLATLLVAVNQILVRLNSQAKLVEKHVVAQQTLENILEELTATSWDELEASSVDALDIPDWVTVKLPGAQLTGKVTLERAPVEAKRVELQLSWQDSSGKQKRPMSLMTWVYRSSKGGK